MKRKRHTEEQIIRTRREIDSIHRLNHAGAKKREPPTDARRQMEQAAADRPLQQ